MSLMPPLPADPIAALETERRYLLEGAYAQLAEANREPVEHRRHLAQSEAMRYIQYLHRHYRLRRAALRERAS